MKSGFSLRFSSSRIVIDKNGETIFFPWHSKGKGYILGNSTKKRRVENFLTGYFWISFVAIIFSPFLALVFENLLLYFGVCFSVAINWLFLYFLVVEVITQKLPVYKLSYKETVLEKLTSDDDVEAS